MDNIYNKIKSNIRSCGSKKELKEYIINSGYIVFCFFDIDYKNNTLQQIISELENKLNWFELQNTK